MATFRLGLSVLGVLAISSVAGEDAPRPPADEMKILGLIDKLPEIAHGDVGFMPSITGSKFSAQEERGEKGTALLGQAPPVDSAAVGELVAMGATAVPYLVEHLSDKRETKICIKHDGGMGGMFREDEYDYNRRTTNPPEGVNRGFKDMFNSEFKETHTVTVGDICFVALGQIVNRHFNAVRYQPTACIMVNSPTESEKLLAVTKTEWGTLTPEQHKQSLLKDIVSPDYENRAEEGIKRLAFYYPDAAEAVVLEKLQCPMFCVFKIEEFARGKLYKKTDPDTWKKLSDEFVARHGAAFKDGLLRQLLDDYDWDRRSPKPDYKADPKKILAHLFPDVDVKKPVYFNSISQSAQARFIDSIAGVKSEKVDAAVLALLKALGSGHFVDDGDDYFALACMRRLITRGYREEIREYCTKHIDKAQYERQEMQRLLDTLNATK
jgi:hypothetical protein